MEKFTKKVKAEKGNDAFLLKSSFYKILLSVSKSDARVINKPSTQHTEGAILEVAAYFGYKDLALPTALSEDEALDFVLNRTGLLKRKIHLTNNWWKETTGPLLCRLKETYVSLFPCTGGGYSFTDPETRHIIRVHKANAELFSGEAYCFYKPFPEERMNFGSLVQFIYSALNMREVIYAVLISVFVVLTGLLPPFFNKVLFDVTLPSGTIKDIFPIMALLLGAAFSSSLFTLLRSLCFMRLGDRIRISVQSAAWDRLLRLPAGFFSQFSSSEILRKIQAFTSICGIISGSTVTTLITVLLSFVYIALIGSFSQALVLPATLISLLMLFLSLLISNLELKIQQKSLVISSKLSALVYQFISGIDKIKISSAEFRVFAQWADLYSEKARLSYSPNRIIVLSEAIFGAIALLSNMYIYFTVAAHQVSPSDFIGFSVAFGSFTYILMQFQGIVSQLASLRSSYRLALPILEQCPENSRVLTHVKKLSGKIDVNSLSFRYAENLPFVLDELSFSISPGDYVAIVGTSGCGKSTLFRLLLKFEAMQGGAIFYDDSDLAGLDACSLRQRIGVVLQNGTLFADDILSNIKISAPWLSLEEVWEIAEQAGLAEDIRAMPMGMFTLITEDGGGISGGQKQKIMIARALASKPDIVMFDEATSALDNINQGIIVSTLENLGITRIVIAHRLSTIKKCNKILVLDKGKLVEEGSYEALMLKRGLFYHIAERQLI